VELQMVVTAQWHREFVADFSPEGSRLGKFEVMCVAGAPLANQTRLFRDEQ
jgi:hypothetical protein